MKQHTLNEGFVLSGKGLHTGLTVTARFLPAAENTGVRICRTDLPDRPAYEAIADYVSATERGTVLQNGDWRVSTVEHALSALYAKGVDNCLIEVDAPEIPILDGSAKYFIEAIERVGLREQEATQKVFVVKQKIELTQGESKIVLLPDDTYSLDVHIGFRSLVLCNQFASLDSLADYPAQIASARTFVFLREIRMLLQRGLIKGGDLQNAVVIYDEPVTQDELDALADMLGQPHRDAAQTGYLCPLLFDNEPARHKLLDIIGDLALAGVRIQGKVIATRPGHGVNTAFAKQLRREWKRTQTLPELPDASAQPVITSEGIVRILPHRYPMLLVDKVLSCTENTIVGSKNFTADEPFFQGHFPGEPVVPGVLLVEAMAQTGGILVLRDKEEPAEYATYLVKADNVKFRQKVVPGDTLLMRLEMLQPIRRGIVVMQAYGFVQGKLVAEALLTAQVTKK